MKVKSIQNYSPFDSTGRWIIYALLHTTCYWYNIISYLYKYNHYNYHWKDLQCASLKVLFDKRNAGTIEMRSHYKKLAYGLCGSVMNSPSSFIIGNVCCAPPLINWWNISQNYLKWGINGTGPWTTTSGICQLLHTNDNGCVSRHYSEPASFSHNLSKLDY